MNTTFFLKALAATLVFSLAASWTLRSWNQGPEASQQNPFLQELNNQLELRYLKARSEKLYLHLDKTWLQPGETLWFAAYVRDQRDLGPALSEILYVQLLNPKGSVLKEIILPVANGKALGDFDIAKDWAGGKYKIKAYTKRGQAQNMLFERDVQVQKPVLPNLNMKLDFARKAYGPSDEVEALLDLNTLDKKALAQHSFQYEVQVAGQVADRGQGRSDDLGQARIKFKLAKDLSQNDVLLRIHFDYKGLRESITRSVPVLLGKMDLQFFPQGGHLLAGAEQVIAFKALNEFGQAADFQAELLDAQGQVLQRFASYYRGMGRFSFKPQANQTYKVRIVQPAGIKGEFALPQAQTSGLSLGVKRQAEQIEVEVLADQAQTAYLTAQTQGKLQFSKVLNLEKGLNTLRFSQTELPIGICQITLFDANKQALAERLIFANENKRLKVTMKTDKDKYLPREEVKLNIEVKDHNNQPVSGDFSLRVVDDKLLSFADDRQGHILSELLLSSDLRGTIEEPNFYFDNPQDPKRLLPEIDRALALDNLLLTQGWRGFTWAELRSETYDKLPPAEKRQVAGQLRNPQGEIMAGVAVKLQDKTLKTDAQGRFLFEDVFLYDKAELSIELKDFIPFTQILSEYQSNLLCTLRNTKEIKGQVKDKANRHLSGVQIYDGDKLLGQTLNGGFFTVQAPLTTKTLSFRYPSPNFYKEQKLNLGQGYDQKDLGVVMDYTTEYQAKLKAEEAEVRRPTSSSLRLKGVPAPPPAPQMNREAMRQDAMGMGGMDMNLNMAPEMEIMNRAEAPRPQALEQKEAKAELSQDRKKAAAKKEEVELPAEELQAPAQELLLPQADTLVAQNQAAQQATRYYRAKVFYTPKYSKISDKTTREDFRMTIYWNPSVQVKNGQAELSFPTSDALTQFSLCLEGISETGQIAHQESKIFSQKPLEIALKLPAMALVGDQISLPLSLSNNSNQTLNPQIQIQLPKTWTWVEKPNQTLQLAPKESKTLWLKLQSPNQADTYTLDISLKDGKIRDQIRQTLELKPRGFPVRQVYAGNQLQQSFALNINQAIKPSIKASLKIHASLGERLISGMESMLRMPSGCFEQTSSSNYPNVLVLQYLRQTQQSNPELEERCMNYLKTGYQRLKGYESPNGGFHWWGYDPGHEALTAYGISQFSDMSQVFSVEPQLIDRSVSWLKKRLDGKGGWQLNPNALHSWAASELTNTFIASCLLQAKKHQGFENEIKTALAYAEKSQDPYAIGLMAYGLLCAQDKRGQNLSKSLLNFQQKDGSFKGKSTSVVNSQGKTLDIETTALAALSLMHSPDALKHQKALTQAIDWLQAQKGPYGFGSTIGTVYTLKALLAYDQLSKYQAQDGQLALYLNGQKQTSLKFKKGQKDLQLLGLETYLDNGQHRLELRYEDCETPLPFELSLEYHTLQPDNSPKCPVQLQTNWANTSVNIGQNLRLKLQIQNLQDQGQGMTMVMLGIPSGLSLQTWQLDQLVKERQFDYYEIFDGYLVLHFEQFEARQERQLALDFKADIAGQYQAPASSAFLYYAQEHRHWRAGHDLTILP